MNGLNDEYLLSEEAAIKQQLEELKSRVIQLHNGILCLKRCSRLSNLLQKMYEIRVELRRLEQGLLQTHLKCCISPNLKVPTEVVLALSKLSEKRHGVIMAIEHEDNLDDHLQGGVTIDAAVSPLILENIFYPGSPLHDGAMIIRDSKIRKVNVLLPLFQLSVPPRMRPLPCLYIMPNNALQVRQATVSKMQKSIKPGWQA